MAKVSIKPSDAFTVDLTNAYTRLDVSGDRSAWLVVYAVSSADGLVWLSTRAAEDSAVADAADRRPLRAPAEIWLGAYEGRPLMLGLSTTEGPGTATIEIVPDKPQPIRQPRGCEK